MNPIEPFYILDLFGVAVFAITGALVAREKQMDIFGVIVVALVTAIGGGTLRDMILGRTPVFWVNDPTYIIVGAIVAVLTIPVALLNLMPRRPLLIADAFGLAVFTVIGTQTALDFGVSAFIAILLGVMSSVTGGIIRDVLSNQIPLILRKEIYATASLCGAVVYVIFLHDATFAPFATITGMMITLVLRLAAIRWGWSLTISLPKPSQ
ncbi:MAG: trimeric intracellular cation channel family protein [Aggregatilineales bacterium]